MKRQTSVRGRPRQVFVRFRYDHRAFERAGRHRTDEHALCSELMHSMHSASPASPPCSSSQFFALACWASRQSHSMSSWSTERQVRSVRRATERWRFVKKRSVEPGAWHVSSTCRRPCRVHPCGRAHGMRHRAPLHALHIACPAVAACNSRRDKTARRHPRCSIARR